MFEILLTSSFLFIFGLFIGSFLHVLADRLPRDEGVLWGRSHCEHCRHTLSAFDLVPLFSYVFLGGKCRYCHTRLSWYYPFGEVLTGVIFVLTFLQFGLISPLLFLFSIFIVSCFIVIFSSDLLYGIIPDKVVYPAVAVTLIFYLFLYKGDLIWYVLSGVGAFLFFLILYIGTKGRGMGFGDVKLSGLMGLVLGFPAIVYALYVAFLTGALVSFILILWKRKHLKSTIPFGPFLVIGILFVLLFPQIVHQIVKLVLP